MCSTDNVAEVMFRDMKKKDGDTYEAIIQGLIKVGYHLVIYIIVYPCSKIRLTFTVYSIIGMAEHSICFRK